MLETLTVQTFTPLLSETFEVSIEPGETARFELVKVNEFTGQPGRAEGARRPFSILFRSAKKVVLAQGMFPFSHPALGTFEIFIVPIQPDREGNLYEAVFA